MVGVIVIQVRETAVQLGLMVVEMMGELIQELDDHIHGCVGSSWSGSEDDRNSKIDDLIPIVIDG
jgi:hypothetical protein